VQRVVEHLDNVKVATEARGDSNRAIGPRLEDHSHIMNLGDRLQQGEARSHIGPSPEVEFANAEVVREVDVDESGRVNPVRRNDFCCFPRKCIGLVSVTRSLCFVQQFADSNQQVSGSTSRHFVPELTGTPVARRTETFVIYSAIHRLRLIAPPIIHDHREIEGAFGSAIAANVAHPEWASTVSPADTFAISEQILRLGMSSFINPHLNDLTDVTAAAE
jgi:hypothetical protein